MSLFSLEEICKGCIHSKWYKIKFMDCAKDNEYAVNAINGTCDTKLYPMKEPDKEEKKPAESYYSEEIADIIEKNYNKSAVKKICEIVKSLTKENADLNENMEYWFSRALVLSHELKSSREEAEISKVVKNADNLTIQSLREMLEAKVEERKWISVNDRLPEDNNEYLILTSNGCNLAYYNLKLSQWIIKGESASRSMYYFVTHWQNLPSPPKE
jgi:hypothetical protein